jgi:hypothetical protein
MSQVNQVIKSNGEHHWYKDGKLHREDGPAIIGSNYNEWYMNGLLHRVNGPAIMIVDVRTREYIERSWYQNGKLHRLDGPAIVTLTKQEWYQNGQLHRLDGPAIELSDGTKMWFVNNQKHRTDGPAEIDCFGIEMWYQNDVLHRTDGPAIIYPDGSEEWYQNGLRHRVDGPAVIMNGKEKWYQNDILINTTTDYIKTIITGKDCSICISDIEGECYKTVCNHHFHIECFNELVKYHNKCPNCRNEFHKNVYDDNCEYEFDF